MKDVTHLPYWLLLLAGLVASAAGALVARFYPLMKRWKPSLEYSFLMGTINGLIIVSIIGALIPNLYVVALAGFGIAYLGSFLPPDRKPTAPPAREEARTVSSDAANRVPLRDDWDRRPRFETLETGMFVGRTELLERLTGDLTARRSGTVLISGVRGVGKTALVERSLLAAREVLQNRYWERLLRELGRAAFWSFEWYLRRAILRAAMTPRSATQRLILGSPVNAFTGFAAGPENPAVIRAMEELTRRPMGRFDWLDPMAHQIRRLSRAGGAQLLVLKFDASDISGAMADPQPAPDAEAPAGKPHVNPEKLMRALIRKLYSTCHPSQATAEASVLKWSLPRQDRRFFVERLAVAYRKSISKAYKETVSDGFKEASKESQSSSFDLKADVIRMAGGLLSVGLRTFRHLVGNRPCRVESHIARRHCGHRRRRVGGLDLQALARTDQ